MFGSSNLKVIVKCSVLLASVFIRIHDFNRYRVGLVYFIFRLIFRFFIFRFFNLFPSILRLPGQILSRQEPFTPHFLCSPPAPYLQFARLL
jgi:hypothetical protein